MSNVSDIEDQRPHAVLRDPVTGNAHVVPLSLIRKWASGEIEPDAEAVRAIVHDWVLDEEPLGEGKNYWVCHCGCTTFHVDDIGRIHCANCDEIQVHDDESYWADVRALQSAPVITREDDIPKGLDAIVKLDSVPAALERITKQVDPETTGFMLAIERNGRALLWCPLDRKDPGTFQWLMDNLALSITDLRGDWVKEGGLEP